MSSTRPNPIHVGWVGLGWTYMIGWVGLNFFDPPWWVWSKNLLTMHTLSVGVSCNFPYSLTHKSPMSEVSSFYLTVQLPRDYWKLTLRSLSLSLSLSLNGESRNWFVFFLCSTGNQTINSSSSSSSIFCTRL